DEHGATDQNRRRDRKMRRVSSHDEPRCQGDGGTEHEETTRNVKAVLEQKYQGRHADWKSKRSDHGGVQPNKMDRGETGEGCAADERHGSGGLGYRTPQA